MGSSSMKKLTSYYQFLTESLLKSEPCFKAVCSIHVWLQFLCYIWSSFNLLAFWIAEGGGFISSPLFLYARCPRSVDPCCSAVAAFIKHRKWNSQDCFVPLLALGFDISSAKLTLQVFTNCVTADFIVTVRHFPILFYSLRKVSRSLGNWLCFAWTKLL